MSRGQIHHLPSQRRRTADQAHDLTPRAGAPTPAERRGGRRPGSHRRRGQPPSHPTSTQGLIRAGFVLISLLFVGFGSWAAVAPLSNAVVAQAVVKVSGDRREVEHLEGGILRRTLVADGERVTAGQKLMLLDDAKLDASRGLLDGKLVSALAREARLLAEKEEGSELRFPAELTRRGDADTVKLMAAQRDLFVARRNTLAGAFRVKDERLAQVREEISALDAQMKASQRQLVYIREEIGDLDTLMAKGLTRKPRLLSMKRQQEGLDGEVRQKQGLIRKSQKEMSGILQEKLQMRLERHDEISRELREVADEVFDARQRIKVIDEQMGRLAVQAPIDGIVIGLGTKTPGAVVSAGERLMEIVPEGAELKIEARVAPTDIDGVHTGAVARVRVTAFNARRTPVLMGHVEQVSADRLEQPVQAAAAQGAPAQPYYKVMVQLPATSVPVGAPVLQAGMPAEVYIETRKLTLLDFLLSPLITGLDRAFPGR